MATLVLDEEASAPDHASSARSEINKSVVDHLDHLDLLTNRVVFLARGQTRLSGRQGGSRAHSDVMQLTGQEPR